MQPSLLLHLIPIVPTGCRTSSPPLLHFPFNDHLLKLPLPGILNTLSHPIGAILNSISDIFQAIANSLGAGGLVDRVAQTAASSTDNVADCAENAAD